jgi:predicted Zn-dependent protease with MMP-like domain
VRGSRLARIASDAVAGALQELPPEIREAAKGVPVIIEATPDDDVLAGGFEPDLLGLFTGSPLGTEFSGEAPEPPRIFLYTANLWDYAEQDVGVYRKEARLTFLHELGHFLGWDEGQIAARGLD